MQGLPWWLNRDWVRPALGVLLPEACPVCRRDLPSSPAVCQVCVQAVSGVSVYCRRCSAPVGPFLDTADGCGHCRRDRFAFESVFAVAEYRDLMRTAVLAAKTPGGHPVAGWLADRLWDRRGVELSALGVDLVLAVPQHWTRRITRPHDAADLIARRLSRRLQAPYSRHILLKTRRTSAQATLSPSSRRTNLRGAFLAVRSLQSRRVLLVDDVLTTGTTADRAARVLRDVGAAAVWVAVAARGIGV